jgi:hypothetical protein
VHLVITSAGVANLISVLPEVLSKRNAIEFKGKGQVCSPS